MNVIIDFAFLRLIMLILIFVEINQDLWCDVIIYLLMIVIINLFILNHGGFGLISYIIVSTFVVTTSLLFPVMIF